MRHFEEFFNIVNLVVFDFSYHSKAIWTFNKIIISTFWSPCLAWSHKLRYALIELDELVWWKFSAWRDNKLSLDFGPKLWNHFRHATMINHIFTIKLKYLFENHRKSLIQHRERSELRLPSFLVLSQKFIKKAKNFIFGEFLTT